MPRKKTEELAVIPEAPVLPIVPEETAEQPVTEECLPETQPILLWRILYLQRVFSTSLRKW